MKDDGGPAFPTDCESQVGPHAWHFTGMTLRDWYAGQAVGAWIQALATRHKQPGYTDVGAADEAARLADITADAMLAACEKEANG